MGNLRACASQELGVYRLFLTKGTCLRWVEPDGGSGWGQIVIVDVVGDVSSVLDRIFRDEFADDSSRHRDPTTRGCTLTMPIESRKMRERK